jgi:hypothetical protein
MIKVKTFTNELKALHTMKALDDLDARVNTFIQENRVASVISVSDACTTGEDGTIGIIRVLAYKPS